MNHKHIYQVWNSPWNNLGTSTLTLYNYTCTKQIGHAARSRSSGAWWTVVMAVGLPSSAAHRLRDLGEVCASSTCAGAQHCAVFAAICVPWHCVEADCCKITGTASSFIQYPCMLILDSCWTLWRNAWGDRGAIRWPGTSVTIMTTNKFPSRSEEWVTKPL